MIIEARVVIHQKDHEHTDYKEVEARMFSNKFIKIGKIDEYPVKLLPGMYRATIGYKDITEAKHKIINALESLDFDISLEVIEVANETSYRLKSSVRPVDINTTLATAWLRAQRKK
jgi:hypothetical protein